MIYCPSEEKLVNEICKDSQGCEIVFESYEVANLTTNEFTWQRMPF